MAPTNVTVIPDTLTAVAIYRVADGKISQVMLLR
jgi:hypothetical protein